MVPSRSSINRLLSASIAPVVFLTVTLPAWAQTKVNPCPVTDSGATDFSGLCNTNLTDQNTLPRIITIVIIVAIVLALAFLIWGGIRWILSGGDKGKVEAARGTIIAAIVGLVIIFLSWFILNVVVTFFTGHGLTDLTLPTISGGVGAQQGLQGN